MIPPQGARRQRVEFRGMGRRREENHRRVRLTVQRLELEREIRFSDRVERIQTSAFLPLAAALPTVYATFVVFFPCSRGTSGDIRGPIVRPCRPLRRPIQHRRRHRIHPCSPTLAPRAPRTLLPPSPHQTNTAPDSYPSVACSPRAAVASPPFVSRPAQASADSSTFLAASIPFRDWSGKVN